MSQMCKIVSINMCSTCVFRLCPVCAHVCVSPQALTVNDKQSCWSNIPCDYNNSCLYELFLICRLCGFRLFWLNEFSTDLASQSCNTVIVITDSLKEESKLMLQQFFEKTRRQRATRLQTAQWEVRACFDSSC